MVQKCMLAICENQNVKNGLSFHAFPPDTPEERDRRQQWIAFVEKTQRWTDKNFPYICSDHFPRDSVVNYWEVKMGYASRCQLTKTAVPAIYSEKASARLAYVEKYGLGPVAKEAGKRKRGRPFGSKNQSKSRRGESKENTAQVQETEDATMRPNDVFDNGFLPSKNLKRRGKYICRSYISMPEANSSEDEAAKETSSIDRKTNFEDGLLLGQASMIKAEPLDDTYDFAEAFENDSLIPESDIKAEETDSFDDSLCSSLLITDCVSTNTAPHNGLITIVPEDNSALDESVLTNFRNEKSLNAHIPNVKSTQLNNGSVANITDESEVEVSVLVPCDKCGHNVILSEGKIRELYEQIMSRKTKS